MPHSRLAAAALAVTAVIAIPAVASTASAVTVGENFTGTGACDGITVIKTVPDGSTSYVVPSDGVLTSWSTRAESGGNRMAAVVYRQVGGNYELVGISDAVVPTGAGLKTYSTNIAVRQGDFFGSWVEKRSGSANVQNTCSGGAGAFTSTWWYDNPNNVLPPTSVVPIASIGSSITGSTTDNGWRYDISGEVGPPAPAPEPTPDPVTPPTPGTPAGSTTPSNSGASSIPCVPAITPQPVPRLAGRLTPPSAGGVVRTRGTVPACATRITQTARPVRGSGATAAQYFPAWGASTSRAGTCTISGSAYLCAIRLGAGRWTITTSAVGATGVVAQSTRRVVVRTALAALPVTG